MITWEDRRGAIAFGHVSSAFFGRRALPRLRASLGSQFDHGARAALIDLSDISKLNAQGAAVLLEASVEAPQDRPIGFYSATQATRALFADTGLDRVLRVFSSRGSALRDAAFSRFRLSDVRAVVLSAGRGRRIAPLSDATPKPMLDILGTPVLGHLLHQLDRAGVRDVITNPGYLAPQITKYVSGQPHAGLSIFCAPEGAWRAGHWVEAPLGSASTLANLDATYGAMSGDTLVLCGDALLDIDFAEFVEHHRRTGADVTIAAKTVSDQQVSKYGILGTDPSGRIQTFQEKPEPDRAVSNLANIGVYVLSAQILNRVANRAGQDIGHDLFPMLLQQGANLQVYEGVKGWADIGCGQDYFSAVAKALQGDITNLAPDSFRHQGTLLIHPEAHVSAGAELEGPIYIAAGAEVRKGAKIVGPSVIGADCVVEGGCDVRRSIIQAHTRVRKNAIVHNMIACGDWAIDHRFADGSTQSHAPLDGVVSKSKQVSLELQNQTPPALRKSVASRGTG